MSASDDLPMYDPEPPVLTILRFLKVVTQTEKAYLLQTTLDHGVWVPKSVCKNFREHLGTVSLPYAIYANLTKPEAAIKIDGQR